MFTAPGQVLQRNMNLVVGHNLLLTVMAVVGDTLADSLMQQLVGGVGDEGHTVVTVQDNVNSCWAELFNYLNLK